MNTLRSTLLTLLVVFTSTAAIGHAAEEDPTEYLQKELKIELANFGKGMAEAFRLLGNAPKLGEATEYISRSEQVGVGYKVGWITKKTEPILFPEYLKISREGAILSGSIVIGKSTQKDIEDRLGKPNRKEREKLSYHLPANAGDDVAIFKFQKGKLAEVQLQWFVD
jgi:hypothetical protein